MFHCLGYWNMALNVLIKVEAIQVAFDFAGRRFLTE
ncbi:hypothetical protein SAMN04487852_1193 [Prevotella sp. tf2-5]|nr:hypothetical protein SAMN04487852_1193 [Prevotella sp. tf2-5]